jgi:hypothetical protein
MNSSQRYLWASVALRALCAVSVSGLPACSTVPNLPPAPLTPPVQTVATNNALPPYFIQVGDVLEIRLLLNPELNEEVVVRPDGHISTAVVADEIAAGRVIVYPKGVWDKEEILPMQIDPNNSAADSFIIHREGGTEIRGIPLTTIDKLVAELNLERVDFIKMDIEAAEPKALIGGDGFVHLPRYRPPEAGPGTRARRLARIHGGVRSLLRSESRHSAGRDVLPLRPRDHRAKKKPVNARRSAPTGWSRIKPNARVGPARLRYHSNKTADDNDVWYTRRLLGHPRPRRLDRSFPCEA